MILNVSTRTDIVAFYTEWFMNRYREGFADVRNPFNPKLVSRFNFDDVDAILFCTKNPLPILKHLKGIDEPIIFHVTLTPCKNDIEPNVIQKSEIIEAIKELSDIVGIDNLYIRYDPIFLSNKYNIEYHKKAFDRMCSLLNGYVKKIIVSFIYNYKNVRKNEKSLNFREFSEDLITNTDSDFYGATLLGIGQNGFISFSVRANADTDTVLTLAPDINAYVIITKFV